MADVFLSYKREDRPAAEQLALALGQLGFDVWWDFALLSGDQYRKVIREVINQCRAAIVLWSKLSAESDFVMDEAAHAKTQGKLCPARVDGVDLPFGFGQLHTDDLAGWSGELSHPGFQSLVRAVEAKTGKKARLGATPRDSSAERQLEELEAFKAAQIAGTQDALRSFLNQHPGGVFDAFVRGQLGEAPARPAPEPPRDPKRAAAKPANIWPIAGFAAAVAIATALWLTLGRNTGETPPTIAKAPVTYDLALLNADVRRAAEKARAAQTAGEKAALDATHAAEAAESAARSARNGEDGYRAFDFGDEQGRHYEGGWANGALNGWGVLTFGAGPFAGDSYAGAFRDGDFSGAGVYTFARNPNNSQEGALLRYEGEWAAAKRNGVGVFHWRDGSRYAGGFVEGQRSGAGVQIHADGKRFESEFARDWGNGFGVLWTVDGTVELAGIWVDDKLATPLSP